MNPTPHAVLMPCALGVPYNGESGPAWRAKWLPCAMHEKIATGFSDGERCLDITLILVKWLQVITGEKITWNTIHWLFMRRLFFSIHFKWEHTRDDRSQAEMAQKRFRHLFQSERDLSVFRLLIHVMSDALRRYFKFLLYFLLKTTFLGFAL